jgi:hypothetical protein
MDRSERPEVNLRDVTDEEILGEIRRRRLPERDIRRALDIREINHARRDLRFYALLLLGALTLLLIGLIGWLVIDGTDIPPLLSGLAGSGLGGIAGILSGGTGGSPPSPNGVA